MRSSIILGFLISVVTSQLPSDSSSRLSPLQNFPVTFLILPRQALYYPPEEGFGQQQKNTPRKSNEIAPIQYLKEVTPTTVTAFEERKQSRQHSTNHFSVVPTREVEETNDNEKAQTHVVEPTFVQNLEQTRPVALIQPDFDAAKFQNPFATVQFAQLNEALKNQRAQVFPPQEKEEVNEDDSRRIPVHSQGTQLSSVLPVSYTLYNQADFGVRTQQQIGPRQGQAGKLRTHQYRPEKPIEETRKINNQSPLFYPNFLFYPVTAYQNVPKDDRQVQILSEDNERGQ